LAKTSSGWCIADSSGVGALPDGTTLGALLAMPVDGLAAQLAAVPRSAALPLEPLLAPVDDDTEVWAAGVTYEVSREARMEESADSAIYARVYDAERPELFFKSIGRRVSGPSAPIGVREDSTWDVPEPELGIVCNVGGDIVGYTVIDDVSSRSIEGENPLYLPQAKMYRGACAVGPWIVLADAVPDPYRLAITVEIHRSGAVLWSGQSTTSRLRRKLADLAAYLYCADVYARGVILATGTSAVPGPDITLRAGDTVTITIEGIGTLANPVRQGLFH
jgi:2-dehydro-3-deoxy-D-arabinonate dehydratase